MTGECVVGIDVGGTRTKAVLADASGAVLDELRRPTPPPGPGAADAVVALAAEIAGAWGDRAPSAVGLAVPGVVDEVRGVGVYSENLGWRDVPFADLLARRTGLPVAVGHDVRAGALAESRAGAAVGLDDVVFLPIGTGIAAGLVLGGRPHAAGGYAGEIGHTDVGHGEPCACGLTGCLEAIASAAAIVRRYRERSGRDVAGAEEVARHVERGDPHAVHVWQEAVAPLARAVCWLAAVLAPEAVVIGGGLAQAGDTLFGPLGERVAAGLSFHRRPRLVPAALGDRAGCLGAALLAAHTREKGATSHADHDR